MGRFKQFDEVGTAFRNSKGKVKAAPDLPAGVRIADTHCHLNMFERPELAIARAAHYGFGFLCCLVDTAERPEENPEDGEFYVPAAQAYGSADRWLSGAREILDTWGERETALPTLRFAVGVHPHNARLWDEGAGGAVEEMLDLLKNPLTCCLGEIGLDYHYDFSPRETQQKVFARQLRLAHETGLPVSLHLREAHADALAILRREGVPEAGCIVHCFNLGPADVEPFVELGCHIAFGGPLTFRKAYYTRDACLRVPLDRLLTETDAPYMAPEPLRGTLCAPDHIVFTLRKMLDCFGYAGEEAAVEALQPRPVDFENGAKPVDLGALDFTGLQCGLTEAEFCDRLYRNALGLLDRPPTDWQRS